MKWLLIPLFLLAGLLWSAGMLPNAETAVYAQSPNSVLAQTATPAPVDPGSAPARVSPWLGILILLAPAVFMVWQKSRPNATLKRNSAACLPIVDKE